MESQKTLEHILNRLKINNETPYCVIEEIATNCEIEFESEKLKQSTSYINSIISICNTLEIKKVTEQLNASKNHGFSGEDLKIISRFVNSKIKKWDTTSLIKSFKHILQIYKEPDTVDLNFLIGDKSPETPFAYNSTMLYRICTFFSIKTHRNTNVEEMGQAIKIYNQDVDDLKEKTIEIIKNFNKIELVNLIMSNDISLNNSPNIKNIYSARKMICLNNNTYDNNNLKYDLVTEEDLEKSYKKLTDYKYLLVKITPNNHYDAIILSSLIYGINLTECKNPLNEFKYMKELSINCIADNKYIPTKNEDKFRDNYLNNINWYDVRKTWSPKLNIIYKPDDIKSFAIFEGYKEHVNQGVDPLEILNISRCIQTFYLGIHPYLTNYKTVIHLDDSCEVNRKLLVSYGIVEEKTFCLYKITELSECFKINRSFSNPNNIKEQFSMQSIEKLKNIVNEFLIGKRDIIYANEIEKSYTELLKSIEDVHIYLSSYSEIARKFYIFYIENKEKVNKCLNLLLHIAYYMRGWKVDNILEPPIGSRTYDPKYQDEVEENTKNSISALTDFLEENQNIKSEFYKLPLMISRKVQELGRYNVIFEPSKDKESGITIIDRLNIVVQGDTTDNMNSCIRMSSNWLLASAYYYLRLCELEVSFKIGEMSEIS